MAPAHRHEPVRYVQAMAVFRQKTRPEIVWTSTFGYSIVGKELPPGELSEPATLGADTHYVSPDPPEQMPKNPAWDSVNVELFLKVGSSDWRSVGTFDVADRVGAPGVDKFLAPAT